jgi:hypothetical protein
MADEAPGTEIGSVEIDLSAELRGAGADLAGTLKREYLGQ